MNHTRRAETVFVGTVGVEIARPEYDPRVDIPELEWEGKARKRRNHDQAAVAGLLAQPQSRQAAAGCIFYLATADQ